MKYRFLFLFIITAFPIRSFCQRITYSESEKDDIRSVNFEVIGKINGNFLVYKNIRNSNAISVYDNDMKLKERVDLGFIPERTLNVDFIPYQDFIYVIYQYQKKSLLHCLAAKLDANAKIIGQPKELDTTHISVFADNKIYSTIFSEDKQKIMIYKIQKKNDKFNYTTILFNSNLELQHESRFAVSHDERKDVYSDFFVDNEGNFVFTQSERDGSRDQINRVFLTTKAPMSDSVNFNEIKLNKYFLDEIKLKVDNVNRRYVLNSFYYNQKRGNIDGLYTTIWDTEKNQEIFTNAVKFSDTLRQEAKTDGALRFAFNDFFIRQIILKKDGGFILSSENYYTTSRGNPWNRYDYLYPNSFYGYNNSLSTYFYGYRPRSYYGNTQTRYYYENVVVMDIDKYGRLVWSNVLHKTQYDDDTDDYLSYQVMNSGDELHFLFNELERRNELITDQSITPDGTLKRNPTLKSLDKGYQFMPKLAKQVSAKQIIVPCSFRNSICFAKIDY